MINTDLSVQKRWVARMGYNNPFTVTATYSGSAFNLSTYVFVCNIRKIGASTNLIQLTEGSGITNGGATGIVNFQLSASNSNLLNEGSYYYEVYYTVGGLTYGLLHGTLDLLTQFNGENVDDSISISVNLAGTDVNVAITLGGGGVSSFSAGNLSPLFTSSVATATTTPALTFTAVNQNANLVYAGPSTGSAAAPTFRAIVAADLGAGADGTKFLRDDMTWQNVASGGTPWELSGGGTFSAPNVLTGSGTNTLKFVFDGLAATPVNGAGAWFSNTTAAAAGAQQISPSVVLEGQGWKTTATAASQSVKFKEDVLPVQGTTNPTGTWRLSQSINGAAYTNVVSVSTGGHVTITGNSAGSSLTLSPSTGSASISFGSAASIGSTSNAASFVPNGTGLILYGSITTGTNYIVNIYNGANLTATSGTQGLLNVNTGFAPTSGTAIFNAVNVAPTINQTGGANGQVTIVNSSPTITASVNVTGYDWNPTTPSNISGTHLAARFVSGAVLLGDTSKSANTGDKVFILSNAGTNATAAQTNGVVLHSKDSSDGSANATLAIYTEQAPEATATFTQTHRIKVWWNNAEYWMSLDAV